MASGRFRHTDAAASICCAFAASSFGSLDTSSTRASRASARAWPGVASADADSAFASCDLSGSDGSTNAWSTAEPAADGGDVPVDGMAKLAGGRVATNQPQEMGSQVCHFGGSTPGAVDILHAFGWLLGPSPSKRQPDNTYHHGKWAESHNQWM